MQDSLRQQAAGAGLRQGESAEDETRQQRQGWGRVGGEAVDNIYRRGEPAIPFRIAAKRHAAHIGGGTSQITIVCLL